MKSKLSLGICASVFVILVAIAGTLIGVFAIAHEEQTLLLVNILFRHGDRTPTETYPNDPYKGENVWQDGWGMLTKKGKQELYALGKTLRNRYGNNFLSQFYKSDEIYVVSSDSDRALMSAGALLAGLYPPQGYQQWDANILWQPLPIHTTPRNLDQLITVTKPCPVYDEELKKAYNSSEIEEINKNNTELYEYLTNHTGKEISNITDVEFLFNTLEIEDMYKLTLPNWTKPVYPGRMKELAKRSLAIFTYSKTMKRLKGGPLVKAMTESMLKKRGGDLSPSNRKMFLYSGHDITIVNVWRTFKFEELIKPNYGASLIVELHRGTDDIGHFVKMFYLNDTQPTTVPYELSIPNCNSPCKLDDFHKNTRPFWPVVWDEECKNQ